MTWAILNGALLASSIAENARRKCTILSTLPPHCNDRYWENLTPSFLILIINYAGIRLF